MTNKEIAKQLNRRLNDCWNIILNNCSYKMEEQMKGEIQGIIFALTLMEEAIDLPCTYTDNKTLNNLYDTLKERF